MKTLYLFRHAKSSWDDPGLDDFDRPLAKRGIKAATRMGEYMREQGIHPDLILCSTAVRARQTLKLALAQFDREPTVQYKDALYMATAADMMALVRKTRPPTASVMLVGHNPGMHDCALDMTSPAVGGDWPNMQEKFPTGALAALTARADTWKDIERHGMALHRFVRPKDLP